LLQVAVVVAVEQAVRLEQAAAAVQEAICQVFTRHLLLQRLTQLQLALAVQDHLTVVTLFFLLQQAQAAAQVVTVRLLELVQLEAQAALAVEVDLETTVQPLLGQQRRLALLGKVMQVENLRNHLLVGTAEAAAAEKMRLAVTAAVQDRRYLAATAATVWLLQLADLLLLMQEVAVDLPRLQLLVQVALVAVEVGKNHLLM
jgi:hypothetical protein